MRINLKIEGWSSSPYKFTEIEVTLPVWDTAWKELNLSGTREFGKIEISDLASVRRAIDTLAPEYAGIKTTFCEHGTELIDTLAPEYDGIKTTFCEHGTELIVSRGRYSRLLGAIDTLAPEYAGIKTTFCENGSKVVISYGRYYRFMCAFDELLEFAQKNKSAVFWA